MLALIVLTSELRLRLNFFFIGKGFFGRMAGVCRATALPLVMALAFLVGVTPVAPAQSQADVTSSQTAGPSSPASPDANDPPGAPSDAVADTASMVPHFKNTRFWLSGQANFIFQAHPDFHADYSGPHSLGPDYDKATSRVLTLYTGMRINDSTELLVDIE